MWEGEPLQSSMHKDTKAGRRPEFTIKNKAVQEIQQEEEPYTREFEDSGRILTW